MDDGMKENVVVMKGTGGLFKISLPVEFLTDDASDEQIAVREHIKNAVQRAADGKGSVVLLPSLTDDNGNRLFDVEYVGQNVVMGEAVIKKSTPEQPPTTEYIAKK